jgi:hypothetical protein
MYGEKIKRCGDKNRSKQTGESLNEAAGDEPPHPIFNNLFVKSSAINHFLYLHVLSGLKNINNKLR